MDLFDSGTGEQLALPDADLVLWRDAGLSDTQALLAQLIGETPWRAEHVTLWGKTHPQPRLVAWYADAGLAYTYSGVTLQATPWTPVLGALRARVEALCETTFNSVLLNYYRDNRDGMGFHADDEPELGPAPEIASVSLGEVRRFVLKHKTRDDVADAKLPLPDGSLLLMRGPTQANWQHGIPKESKPCGPRVNLTFRTIRY